MKCENCAGECAAQFKCGHCEDVKPCDEGHLWGADVLCAECSGKCLEAYAEASYAAGFSE